MPNGQLKLGTFFGGAGQAAIQHNIGVRAQRGGGFQDIIKQMQAAQEKANLLNEQRYQQILGQFEGLGQAGRARIEQQTLQRQAEATQSLMGRGLGGTTITSAVGRGIAGEGEMQRQQLEESVAMQKAGVMERRTDVGPDLGMFAGLLQAAGQQQQQPFTVTRQMGPMAARGLDIFGRPMGGRRSTTAPRPRIARQQVTPTGPPRQGRGVRTAPGVQFWG